MTPDEEAALAELVFSLTAPHTQEEIADHLGISQQKVSRIEQRALAKMRAALEKKASEASYRVDTTDMW